MTLIFTFREPVSFSPEDGKPLPRKVHFAADYMANNGVSYEPLLTPKYRTYGDWLFAFCGDLRVGQLLAHSINEIEKDYEACEQKSDYDFTVEYVIDHFQEAIQKANINLNDPTAYVNFDGILITPSSRVFLIGQDLSVCELENPLWVTGSGALAAKAVWDVLNDMSWDIFEGFETLEQRIRATYRYVSRNDLSVGSEIDYIVLEQKWDND